MNIHLLSVVNAGTRCQRPSIAFYADWLPDMGFTPGALAAAAPCPGGMLFSLCDENIKRYSELDAATKEKGGRLIQARHATGLPGPALAISGEVVTNAGLVIGDALIAFYEYGLIRVRKNTGGVRAMHVTSRKDKLTGLPVPMLCFTGGQLPEFGFVRDALVTAAITCGCITFELRDEGIDKYSDLVRFTRQNRMKLLQVRQKPARGNMTPYIALTGSCLTEAGFAIGDGVLAVFTQGRIKVQNAGVTDMAF